MIHETLREYDYVHLLSDLPFYGSNSIAYQDVIIRKNVFNLIDCLILTYNNPSIESKYFNEFWLRREKEGNKKVVFNILEDINLNLHTKRRMQSSIDANDTLLSLLNIEFKYDTLTDKIAKKNFDLLVKLGFHQSAYNLLYQRYEYYDIDWDQEELKKQLTAVNSYQGSWFEDNTK